MTYRIVRFYQHDDMDSEIVRQGLTLEEAQAHCNDPETSSATATTPFAVLRTLRCGPWFDGYTDEDRHV